MSMIMIWFGHLAFPAGGWAALHLPSQPLQKFTDVWTSNMWAPMHNSEKKWSQSCPTLCDPVACIPPGSSIHGILQARILEWVAISFSRGASHTYDTVYHPHNKQQKDSPGRALVLPEGKREQKMVVVCVLQWLLSGARMRQPPRTSLVWNFHQRQGKEGHGLFFFFF